MKCPVCGKENQSNAIKKWNFNVYDVSRYKCSECGELFNLYESEKGSYTIPKSRR